MSQRFYQLNGFNDPSLKHTYVSSLPQELQPKIHRIISAAGRDIDTMTFGQIHQTTLEALEELCSLHQHFSEMMEQKSKFGKACKKNYLEIGCKKEKCHCPPKRKKDHKSKSSNLSKTKKKTKFFKPKQARGKRTGQRCFACGKKGHYSKNCPNKPEKAAKMIDSLNPEEADLESLYSEQSSADEHTAFALREDSGDESNSDPEEKNEVPVYYLKQVASSLPTPPLPCVEIQVLASKFAHPKKAIAYMDTGAQVTMMNPSVLPSEAWTTHAAFFMAADGKIFRTDLITKEKIGIKFF